MGNASLRDLAVITEVALEDLHGITVAIDAYNWLYKYLTTTTRFTSTDAYTTADGDTVPNLIGVIQGLPRFLDHDITPVFVFDGEAADLKADELADRRADREAAEDAMEAAREEGDAVTASIHESRAQTITPTIRETTRTLFDHLDVPYLDAPGAGEAQAAYMARTEDWVDSVGSDDYDTLLCGAPVTIRDLTSQGTVERMDLDATLSDLALNREQLVDAAILMGTDYNDGVDGYGPKTAVEAVRNHGSLDAVIDAEDIHIDNADAIRTLFLDPEVTDEYPQSPTIGTDADIDAARTFVCDEWEIPVDEVDRGFDRIKDAVTQTGLDRWT